MTDEPTRIRSSGSPPADPRETRPNTADPQLQSILANRYVLQERLGAGGMGTVFKALDREVAAGTRLGPALIALKIVNPDKDLGQVAITAIKQEGEFLRRLRHDNIVAIYSVERDGATWFLTMELLEGESLDSIVKRFPGGVELAEGLPLIRQLSAGITYLHEHKVIHSDLKPSNVFVTRDRQVKILDFGISSKVRAIGEPETLFNPRRWGALTPPYACLEMWSGATPDPRDDVYSFGCLVYELLTGHHPFGGASAQERAGPSFAQQSVEAIPGLARHQNAALQRTLALHRQDRTSSIALFHDEFFRAPASKVPAYSGLAASLVLVVASGILLTHQGLIHSTADAGDPRQPARSPTAATSSPAQPAQPPTVATSSPTQPAEPPAAGRDPVLPQSGASPARTTPAPPQVQRPQTNPPNPIQQPSPITAFPRKTAPTTDCVPTKGPQDLLDRQVRKGLEAQRDWSLGNLSESDNAKVLATISSVADCLRQLAQQGYTSAQSRAWLVDAESILKGNEP